MDSDHSSRSVCIIQGCTNLAAKNFKHGLCHRHYRDRRYAGKTCSVEGCESQVTSRGMCYLHYTRWRKTGTTDERVPPTDEERLWSKIDRSGGPDACWPWTTDSVFRNGYGQFTYMADGKCVHIQAHRMVWIFVNGPIEPPSLLALHTCDNPPCCNPRHLFLGTHSINTRDAVLKCRTNTVKLTKEQVREIRQMYVPGKTSQQEIADLFGVGQTQVSRIVRNDQWDFLGDAPLSKS